MLLPRIFQKADVAAISRRACSQQSLQAPVLGSSNRPLKSLTDLIMGNSADSARSLLQAARRLLGPRSVIVRRSQAQVHPMRFAEKNRLGCISRSSIRR